MKRLFAVLAAVLVALSMSARASAHDVKGELVFLDIGEKAAHLELQIPTTQLRAVAPEFFPGPDHDIASLTLAPIPAYVEARLFATDRRGERLTTHVDSARIDGNAVIVEARLDGNDVRYFTLHDEVILDRVVTHSVFVFLRRDLRSGDLGESPRLLGEIHYQNRALVVDRTEGSAFAIVKHALALGVHHIAEGTDHILFLLMLLLAMARGTVRSAAVGTAKIVTAFTLGHSVSLALATVVHFESGNGIEILIALSILVTALHALRPLFPTREPIVAAAFGLVHGLAFASALVPFGFDRTTLVLSLLGFNLGVEAMQLAIVLVAAPVLTLLSGVRMVRVGGGVLGSLAALGWLAERVFDVHVRLPLPALGGGLLVMIVVDHLSRRAIDSPA